MKWLLLGILIVGLGSALSVFRITSLEQRVAVLEAKQ